MGRPAGSTNQPRQQMLRALAEKYPQWNPVQQMAEMANDESLTHEQRFAAAKEVAQYVTPKLRSVEVTGQGGGPIQINLTAPGDASL